MKSTNLHAILAVVVGFCLSAVAFGQLESRGNMPAADKYVISARAGGVNAVEGTVTIIRTTGKSGVLLKRDQVEVGDRVTTGPDGRAEVLLNPGSFIRLGKNSSFEFGATDLEDLQIRLDSGSAMFEVFASDEFRVSVLTPKGKVALVDTGLYRVDISTDGTALVGVTKGKAEVGEDNETIVKGGRTGTIGTETVAIAKFDKDKRDDLAEWSRSRSKELTKLNANLNARVLSGSLLTGFRSGRWSMYDSFGLWIFDASFGGFCFLPFGNQWRSPYGYWYNNGIYPNYYPIITPPVNPPSTRKVFTPVVAGGSVGSNENTKVDELTRIKRSAIETGKILEPPPFTRVTRGGGDLGGGISNDPFTKESDFGIDRSNTRTSTPSYSPPPPPPPPVVVTPGNSRIIKDN